MKLLGAKHILHKLETFNFIFNSQWGGGWDQMLQCVVLLWKAFGMCEVH